MESFALTAITGLYLESSLYVNNVEKSFVVSIGIRHDFLKFILYIYFLMIYCIYIFSHLKLNRIKINIK